METKSKLRMTSLCTMTLGLGLGACQTLQTVSESIMLSTSIDTSSKRHIKVGDTFSIQLRSNPTTDYSWQLAEPFDKTRLEKVSNHYQADANPNRMVGVGGTETLMFKALKSGHAKIQVRYIRSWEAQDTAAQVAKYQIEID